ncbi:MAG: GlsB/YeaQ/YmgE family stress response membrane protein [Gaiellaceae bacterium]
MLILRQQVMLGAILSLLVSGLIIGLLARFAVPGKDPLRLWQTILLGIAGSLVGGVVAGLLGVIDADDTIEPGEALASIAFSLAGAIVLLILYRKLVQKRPLTGPGAR